MGIARNADGYSVLLAAGRGFNADHLSPPLRDAEVEKTARKVWDYQVEGRNWVGSRGHVPWSVEQVLSCAFHKHSGDATILMTVLRANHSKRDGPFAVAPRAMARDQVIPGWTEHRTRQALKAALQLGWLNLVYKGGHRLHDPSLYELPPACENSHQYN